MNYQVTSQFQGTVMCIVVAVVSTKGINTSFAETYPSDLLRDDIDNDANTATNFLTNAVEKPKNLLINATGMTTGVNNATSNDLKLRRLLEKFRVHMRNGIPELGIPPLEPFTYENIVILDDSELSDDSLKLEKFNLWIKNIKLRNLSNFLIDQAKLSLIGPTISVNISIPEILITGYYDVSLLKMFLEIDDLPFKGLLKIIVRDFRAYVNTELDYDRGLYMKRFDLDFSLRDIKIIHMNYDNITEQDINKIEDLLLQLTNYSKPDILPFIKDYVVNYVNKMIYYRFTTEDLLRLFS